MVAAIESPPVTVDGAGEATVWNGDSVGSLLLALAPPTVDCVEAGVIKRWRPQSSSHRRLGLTLTAGTAFRFAVAKPFLDAMEQRVTLSESLRVRIHTALHEALTNAVLHGNVGLESRHRDSFAGLANIQGAIDARLKIAEVALSAICIEACWDDDTLHVLVRDSGIGYSKAASSDSADGEGARPRTSGRGLVIVDMFSDSVEVLDGGTAIKMGFCTREDPPRPHAE